MNNIEKNPNPIKDQHFMVDQDMLNLIYQTANIQKNEMILEIGGGAGALTDYLVTGDNYVTVIEKDPYYAKLLTEKYKDYPNVTVIEGDALEFDTYEEFDRIVANLPYTITEPFLMKLASSGSLNYDSKKQNSSNLKSVTLVVSQNSTRKMVAPIQIYEGKTKHSNQEFGIIGAITKSFFDVDIVSAIPSEAFYPEPAVTSFLVNLTPKKAKTPVDRIMRELLTDKKGLKPSIKRVYQLMLSQEKIYKPSKHKQNIAMSSNTNFTSHAILTKNIYDLNNCQLSTLIQDLIKNDINIKSRNSSYNRHRNMDDVETYYVNGRLYYGFKDNYEDDYDDDYEDDNVIKKQSQSKFERKYDYMYDATIYNLLLHRGIEYIDPVLLKQYINGDKVLEEEKQKQKEKK